MQEHVAKQLVFVMGTIAQTMITAFGMMAANQYRTICGNQIAYGEEAFYELINDNGLTHNQLVTNVLQI